MGIGLGKGGGGWGGDSETGKQRGGVIPGEGSKMGMGRVSKKTCPEPRGSHRNDDPYMGYRVGREGRGRTRKRRVSHIYKKLHYVKGK